MLVSQNRFCPTAHRAPLISGSTRWPGNTVRFQPSRSLTMLDVIALHADDTLWHNETWYLQAVNVRA